MIEDSRAENFLWNKYFRKEKSQANDIARKLLILRHFSAELII